MKLNYKNGFTLLELLIALGVMSILIVIVFAAFISLRKSSTLQTDTETIVEILRQARSQTMTSQSASRYGVHIASDKVTLFTGSSYNPNDTTNQNVLLNTSDTVTTISLSGGGSDVIFNRLSGETAQNGTVVISSPTTGKSKTVIIYKTGVVEVN